MPFSSQPALNFGLLRQKNPVVCPDPHWFLKRAFPYPPTLGRRETMDNAIQPERLVKAPRRLARTRKGTKGQSLAVKGWERIRMHGGSNPGTPLGFNLVKILLFTENLIRIKLVRLANVMLG